MNNKPVMTRYGTSANASERPMTSNKAMGYKANLGKENKEPECK